MTREQLDATEIRNEHGKFYPRYDMTITYQEVDGENVAIEDYTITVTAEEVYQEYLNPPKPQPSEVEVLEVRVDGLENINAGLLLENANQQVEINEQEMTNAQMLLEIAMLKGAML